MNWKKTLLYAISSTLVGGLGGYVATPGSPFTFKSVGIPAILTLASTITALFTQPPHTDGK